MKELIKHIAQSLVDYPDAVSVKMLEGSQVIVYELYTHPQDLGKVIGRQGRIVHAMRTLLGAIGMKLHKRFTLQVVSDGTPQAQPARHNLASDTSK